MSFWSANANRASLAANAAPFALKRGDLKILEAFLNARGGEIRVIDLDKVYGRFPMLDPTRARFYASLSDGRNIYINQSKHVDVPYIAWDVCHLLGHMVQWNLNPSFGRALGLRYYDAVARDMAVADFRGASVTRLREVIAYETEANRIAFSVLGICLGSLCQQQIREGFREYVRQDLDFLLSYYSGLEGPSGLSPELSAVLQKAVLSVVQQFQLPSVEDCSFRTFDILSVPVLHLEHPFKPDLR